MKTKFKLKHYVAIASIIVMLANLGIFIFYSIMDSTVTAPTTLLGTLIICVALTITIIAYFIYEQKTKKDSHIFWVIYAVATASYAVRTVYSIGQIVGMMAAR